MDNDLKIGLSRCRLFDFQNCVSFVGEYCKEFNEKEMQKAMRMLSVRYPVITAQIEVNEEAEAFLQLEKYTPEAMFFEGDVTAFVRANKAEGIDYRGQLFKFFVVNKNTLVIFSHTIISDAKSLLILAKELLAYYNKETVLVEPKSIKLFSTEAELPLEAESFVADRVTEVLNNSWLEKPSEFCFDDYKKAQTTFVEKKLKTGSKLFYLDAELCIALKTRCEELKIDFSSAVAFALLKTLIASKKTSKKEAKPEFQVDRRPYFTERDVYSVGAFNGAVLVEAPKDNVSLTEQVVALHKSYYKKFSECFNAFYNELFLSKLEPSFLDSTFIYKAGQYNGKPTKKLASLYGCEQKILLGFSSYNLTQHKWEKLSTFHHVLVNEPHKSNKSVSATLVMGEKNTLYLEWETSEFSSSQIEEVYTNFVSVLQQL